MRKEEPKRECIDIDFQMIITRRHQLFKTQNTNDQHKNTSPIRNAK
jgi:hypothetical protein